MNLSDIYHRVFPYSAHGAGIPGMAKPRLTPEEKRSSAASYLARYAARLRREREAERIRAHLAALRACEPAPIPPREVVVADIIERRAVR